MNKKTVVLGASIDEERYSFKAANMLKQFGHEIILIGARDGNVSGEKILIGQPSVDDVDTVTMYLSPSRQKDMYDYVLSLHPKRIIFNPGSENHELAALAESKGIITEEACTLVLLRTGQY